MKNMKALAIKLLILWINIIYASIIKPLYDILFNKNLIKVSSYDKINLDSKNDYPVLNFVSIINFFILLTRLNLLF